MFGRAQHVLVLHAAAYLCTTDKHRCSITIQGKSEWALFGSHGEPSPEPNRRRDVCVVESPPNLQADKRMVDAGVRAL